MLREEFPITSEYTFFNHAAISPIPRRALTAVTGFLTDLAHRATEKYLEWQSVVEETRALFAKLIDASPDEIAFVKNTTEGIAIVAEGLDWRYGDNVVLPDIEFPANVYPWMNLGRRGVQLKFVRCPDGLVPTERIVDAIDDRTRVVTVSAVQFSSGFRCQLEALGEICRERGILFFVDGIQQLGALDLSVKRCHIDFLSSDGHKWLLSTEGAGCLYISRERLEDVRPVMAGWRGMVDAHNFLDYRFEFLPTAARFEMGSLNMAGIYALRASISMLLEAGIENVEREILSLTDYLIEGLVERGYPVVSSRKPEERSGIVVFRTGEDPREVVEKLRRERIITTPRGKGVRLSPHCYNTKEEADRFLEILPGVSTPPRE